MKINKEDRCCTFCKFWNPMNGYCKKKDRHTHGVDNVCEQWKKAKEFVDHRPKGKKPKELSEFAYCTSKNHDCIKNFPYPCRKCVYMNDVTKGHQSYMFIEVD